MPRFQRRLDCDSGYADGALFLYMPGATTTAGLSSLALTGAATYNFSLSELLRTGVLDDLQEAFGGGATSAGIFARANGSPSPPAVYTTPAGVSGSPPYAGISQLTPVTSARPKGWEITSITPIVTVTTAITSTFNLYQTLFVNSIAAATTTIVGPLTANIGISTDNVTPVAVPTPVWMTGLNAQYVLTWAITAGAGTVYGVRLGIQYNYN
jgi:hypothetical protein